MLKQLISYTDSYIVLTPFDSDFNYNIDSTIGKIECLWI